MNDITYEKVRSILMTYIFEIKKYNTKQKQILMNYLMIGLFKDDLELLINSNESYETILDVFVNTLIPKYSHHYKAQGVDIL